MNYAALSASDGSGEAVRTTVQAVRAVGSTAITVNATTNWPTGAFIATTGTLTSTGTLNPTTVQVFYGTASGTTITITSFAPGYTDKGNAINDVVVLKPSTEWANVVASALTGTGTISTVTQSNPYKFSVYWNSGGANYMTTADVFYQMLFDTKAYDTGNNFNTTTHLFTAPITGFYHLSTICTANNGTQVGSFYLNYSLNGNKNNGAYPFLTTTSTNLTANTGITLPWDVHLNAGDTVGVYMATGLSGIGIAGGAGTTFLSGFLVSAT